jgi:hypothetical protein
MAIEYRRMPQPTETPKIARKIYRMKEGNEES